MQVECSKCGCVFEILNMEDVLRGCPKCGNRIFISSRESVLKHVKDDEILVIEVVKEGIYKINVDVLQKMLKNLNLDIVTIGGKGIFKIAFPSKKIKK